MIRLVHLLKKNFLFVIIVLIVISIVIILKFQETKSNYTEDENDILDLLEKEESNLELTSENIEEETTYIVDIKGEVNRPGVYEVNTTSRVNDVIQLAGGFTDEADQNFVNLAQKVQDEMVIIIPKIGEEHYITSRSNMTIDDSRVNINQASKDELETLPGIGPAKAQAILDFREENGSFKEVEDLLQVNGIGEKTLENLIEYIDVR